MVRHIVAWSFAESFSREERLLHTKQIKSELENLKNLIPGIISIEVFDKHLSSSDSDIVLDSVFETEDTLKAYQVHPEHLRVATTVVRPATCNRKCIDFEM